jgi:hypothetical protein
MPMKIMKNSIILLVYTLLIVGAACGGGGNAEPTATPIATETPTPLPTVVMSCDQARDAIQIALDAYNAVHGDWPTIDGQPGDIEWSKLALDFIDGIPSNDNKCEWWVNSNPEGDVCLQNVC